MKATIAASPATILLLITLLVAGLALSPQRVAAEDFYPDDAYSREELAQMLAPIALYPDALLSQVLMAATYPIEVIEADRWLSENSYLQGETLDVALADEDWDPSVKSLCHFPSILALMSERIGETTDLGNAFLAQEAEVMDMVQELRAAAYAQGRLYTTAEQRVIVERQTIIIEPATRVIYVPYYDPYTIYGSWWYPAHPPWYWAPSGVRVGFGIAYWPGIYFNFTFVSWSRFDWHRRHIHIDVHHRPRYVRHDHWVKKPGRWHHAPVHRRGFAYRDKPTAKKYGHPSQVVHRDGRDFPKGRDRNRDYQDLQRDQRRDNRQHLDRQRVERPRTIPDRQLRQHQERLRTAPDRHRRPELDRHQRQPGIEHVQSVQTRPDPQKQRGQMDRPGRQQREFNRDRSGRQDNVRQDSRHVRPQQVSNERTRPVRQPVAANPPKPEPTDQAGQSRRVERRQVQESRVEIPNRTHTGRRDDQSHGHGRVDRQEREDGSGGRDRVAGENHENRGNRFGRDRDGR